MRSAIFFGLLMIGMAIEQKEWSTANIKSVTTVILVFFFMDIIELFNGGKK